MGLLEKAEEFARKQYPKNNTEHRWHHIEAVMKRALELAKHFDDVDIEALKLAIIFHDIDYTTYETHVDASAAVAEKFLMENKYPAEKIEKVKEIMLCHSGPHRRKLGEAKLQEGRILYDADKSVYIETSRSIEVYEKVFPQLYLEETRQIVRKA